MFNINIFFLSYSPEQSARWMVDKHVVKMILESAQLLSTAHRVLDGTEYYDISGKRKIKRWDLLPPLGNVLYKATHVNHPSAVWVREAAENYNWLFDHFQALLEEYNYRFKKVHACNKLSVPLMLLPENLEHIGMTPIKCAMDQKFIVSEDPVENYRNYYRNGKQHLFKWTHREPPVWITNQ